MEQLVAGDLTLTYLAAGAGAGRAPILFIHGFLGGAWYFEKYQRSFAARGYPAYAVNLRGHHGSRPVPDIGRVSLEDYVDDVRDAARWIDGRHHRPPILFGHSMGGLLASKAAELEPALAAGVVMLCAAPPRWIPLFSFRLAARQAKHLAALAMSRPIVATFADDVSLNLNRTPAAEHEAIHARFVPESGRAGRELSLGTLAVDASRVRCPVLSVSAADDHFVPPRVGLALAKKFRAPWMLFPEHAHLILTEPGWEKPAAVIEGWMREEIV